jgi:hypothetical protein
VECGGADLKGALLRILRRVGGSDPKKAIFTAASKASETTAFLSVRHGA